jgi:hypothetical protein
MVPGDDGRTLRQRADDADAAEQRQRRQALPAAGEGGCDGHRQRGARGDQGEWGDGEPRGKGDPERQRGGERKQGRAGPSHLFTHDDELADRGELLRAHAEHVTKGVRGLEAAAALPLGQDAPGQALANARADATARRGSRG